MAAVRFAHVVKRYPGHVQAVSDFNLTIADGEFVVLVGPSGCGKSTSLRMLAGLEEISGGTISIGDRVINDVPPKDRDIAMVFQNYALYPHMTVYDNMAFALKLRHVPKAEIKVKVERAAQVLGIVPLLARRPKALSGGQRQRVAVGRAIVREPKCFLFDEPLSNLDAKLRVEMRAELKRLHQDLKTTTVYVTHDQEEAMTLGDRIVVMKDGLMQQVGAPLAVYRHPVNRFVATFVGTPPMNILRGTLVRRDGRLLFDDGHQTLPIPPWALPDLTPREGQPVDLGIRPEAIHHSAPAGSSDYAPFTAHVRVVEPLGDRMDVFLTTPAHAHLLARVDAHATLPPDRPHTFALNLLRLHFFSPDPLGLNLALPAELATHSPAPE